MKIWELRELYVWFPEIERRHHIEMQVNNLAVSGLVIRR